MTSSANQYFFHLHQLPAANLNIPYTKFNLRSRCISCIAPLVANHVAQSPNSALICCPRQPTEAMQGKLMLHDVSTVEVDTICCFLILKIRDFFGLQPTTRNLKTSQQLSESKHLIHHESG
jgi:hypothetical protein